MGFLSPASIPAERTIIHLEYLLKMEEYRDLVIYIPITTPANPLLLSLEVVEDDGSLVRLLTPVLNYDAGAVDDLARVTLSVQNA